jgi:hypothetical protein
VSSNEICAGGDAHVEGCIDDADLVVAELASVDELAVAARHQVMRQRAHRNRPDQAAGGAVEN